jgi:hypothetical protein
VVSFWAAGFDDEAQRRASSPLAGGNAINTSSSRVNERFNNASSNVSNNRFLGNTGGGFEYRFTHNIAVFGEASYNFVGGGNHNFNSSLKNFIQTNFGFRFAFLAKINTAK